MCLSSLKTLQTCTGRGRVFWSTCNRSQDGCQRSCILSSGRTRRAQDGFMNTRLWTTAINAVWPTCAAFKIGISATSSKLFPEWPREPPLADSCASTRSTSTPTNFALMESLSRRSLKKFEQVQTKLVDACLKWAGLNTWLVDSAICVRCATWKLCPLQPRTARRSSSEISGQLLSDQTSVKVLRNGKAKGKRLAELS